MATSHWDDAALDKIARGVVDSLLEGGQVIGPDWRYLYVNDTIARQARCARAELLGRSMLDCFPGIEASPMFAVLRRRMTERTHDRMKSELTPESLTRAVREALGA